ncbi:MAG: SET domain-containing protein [bacterium]
MKLVIKKTKTGKGVFAGQQIKKGESIRAMSGQRLSWGKVEPLVLSGALNVDDPFQVGENSFMVLDPEPRYFNHSCEPNAGVGEGSVLVALQDITKGEEIFFDYSTTVCTHCEWKMSCACGSGACRKVIRNAGSVSKKVLKKYVMLGVLPQFIKKELSI